MILPEPGSERIGVVIVYDLSDADQWEQAREDRELWGRSRSEVHALGTDHIVIEFKPEGALETSP
jgi:hypothetical protein